MNTDAGLKSLRMLILRDRDGVKTSLISSPSKTSVDTCVTDSNNKHTILTVHNKLTGTIPQTFLLFSSQGIFNQHV